MPQNPRSSQVRELPPSPPPPLPLAHAVAEELLALAELAPEALVSWESTPSQPTTATIAQMEAESASVSSRCAKELLLHGLGALNLAVIVAHTLRVRLAPRFP